jgi:hypothetical protein
MISRMGWVKRVRISEMLAPYKTDSRVGSKATEIPGRHETGVNWDE